jgi:hypothetical protein
MKYKVLTGVYEYNIQSELNREYDNGFVLSGIQFPPTQQKHGLEYILILEDPLYNRLTKALK